MVAAAPLARRVFGTYNKTGPLLELALQQALGEAGGQIFLIDTAAKYGNHAEVAKVVKEHPGVRVGSKVNHPGQVAADLAEMEAWFGGSLYRVLLHKPMPLEDWRVLERAKKDGRLQEIGVSNYSAELLEQLLAACEVPPDVVQNELHACIATPVVRLCRRHSIRFEAHSVMAANAHLAPAAERLGVSPAEVAIAFCLALGADVCFSTGNLEHLRRDMHPRLAMLLSERDVGELEALAYTTPIRIYRAQGAMGAELEVEALEKQLSKDIAAFEKGEPFSDLCRSIPKTHRGAQGDVTKLLAKRIFPEYPEPPSWQKLDGLLHKMRKQLENRDDQRRAAHRALFPKKCALPREAVANPDALPVDIPASDLFRPFLDELRSWAPGGDADAHPALSSYPRKFEKGTLFPDGRMDLCKQVIQPCFVELCEAVKANPSVKHFLLGNNVVFRDGTEEQIQERMEALVGLLRTDPAIETWYLAGNGISAPLCGPLARGLRGVSSLKALWLKMNPVQGGARDLGELAREHRGLELLDLFNTGLRDAGVLALRDGLGPTGSPTLRHLYLSINDISDGAAVAEVVRLLPSLESLFLGVNFLGDDGARPVLEALVDHPTLRRLEIGANGLTDTSLPLLLKVAGSTRLLALILGSYKSTRYFDGKHNVFADAPALVELASKVRFLRLDGAIEAVDLDAFREALLLGAPETCVYATQGVVGTKRVLSPEVTHDQRLADLSRLAHPLPFVDNIQSIYRNAM